MDEAEHKIEEKVKVTEGPTIAAPAPGSPDPSRLQVGEPSGIAGVIAFVVSAFGELQKITWPDRQQVIKETLSVIVLVAIITAAVLAFDYALGHLVFNNIDHLARKFGGGIGVHH